MSPAQQSSKFGTDALLFKPEPPIDRRHVKALFYGREAELKRGLQSLKANLDISGKRSKRADKRPWVIHGESRSGKSHLARRVFADLPKGKKRIQCIVPAGGRLDAVAVMRDLFENLRGEFKTRVLDQSLSNDPMQSPQVKLVDQLIEKIALFETGTTQVTLSLEQENRESNEVGVEAGGAPLLFKFLGKYQTQRSQKNAVQLSLRPPSALDLAEVCGIMIETLLGLKLIQHALILADDIDLLEGYVSAQQNARQQRSLLAHALDTLHGAPGVDVVLTARSWYAHTRKELQTLVDLAESDPMNADELMGIYDRRWQLYGGRKSSPGFLARAALQQLGGDVEGLPGVFLQHLDMAYYQYQNETQWGERDYDWVLGVFRRRLDTFREKCAPGLEAIQQAINRGSLNVDVTHHYPFFGTVLENEFVYQSYYSETTYFVSGLVRKLLLATPQQPIINS